MVEDNVRPADLPAHQVLTSHTLLYKKKKKNWVMGYEIFMRFFSYHIGVLDIATQYF